VVRRRRNVTPTSRIREDKQMISLHKSKMKAVYNQKSNLGRRKAKRQVLVVMESLNSRHNQRRPVIHRFYKIIIRKRRKATTLSNP
jgi:hypothetical protein